jgi:peptidyl-dipeptidase A
VSAQSRAGAPTAAEARTFLDEVNQELLRLINYGNRTGWVQSTYITPDTELLNAQANEQLTNAITKYAKGARRFDTLTLPPLERRQMQVLENSLTLSAPPDPKEAEELARLLASMEGAYGSGKYCPASSPAKPAAQDDCLDIEKITEILAENRDPKRLQEAWEGWHTISIPMRKDYRRFVELSNKGAGVLDYPDTGADVARQIRHAR